MHGSRVLIVNATLLLCVAAAVAQQATIDPSGASTGGLANALVFGGSEPKVGICVGSRVGEIVPCPNGLTGPTGEGITSARTGPNIVNGQPLKKFPNEYGLDFYTNAIPRLSISHEGLVGIGTQSPAALLDLQRTGNVDIGIASQDGAGRRWVLRSGGQALTGAFQIVDAASSIPRIIIDYTGLVSVRALQITGGSDLAEPFQTSGTLPSGSLVSIDPKRSGTLVLSSKPYDHCVAGVVSGAAGITPGVLLSQLDADGSTQQVALAGRVYAFANVSGGRISAGDLLTTSSVPGEAMRASNSRRAQGAVIGKAMTALRSGSGMVLVLVRPQ